MGAYKSLFVLTSFFLAGETQTGKILPPQNVSLKWITDFQIELSWTPPPYTLENCQYVVTKITKDGNEEDNVMPPWTTYWLMNGHSLHFLIATECNGIRSETIDIKETFKVLVKDFECEIRSPEQTHCSWTPYTRGQDLNFSYALLPFDCCDSSCDKRDDESLQACLSYTFTDGVRTGCNLKASACDYINISFSTVFKDKRVRNTFLRTLTVNLAALNWNVTKAEENFIINLDPPAVFDLSYWKFTVNYTECNENKTYTTERTTINIIRVPRCPYSFAIMGRTRNERGETSWSEYKHFDADTDPNAFMYVVFIIPLMFASLALLTFLCCRKYKDNIFPEIPQPRDLITDISENNNTSNFWVPSEDEDTCKITLVMDPENKKLIF